ncbi:MAG: hypothetical protein ACP5NK_03425 [Thermoplasmata archaeon]
MNAYRMINNRYILPAAISSAYWVIFAMSSGMIQYYTQPQVWLFTKGIGSRPLLIIYTDSLHNFLLLSGIYWFPSEYLGITLQFLPAFLSVALSFMVFLMLLDFNMAKTFKKGLKGALPVSVLTFPAICSTGACCSLPVADIILSFVSESSAIAAFKLLASVSYPLDMGILSVMIYLHLGIKKQFNRISSRLDQ